MASPFISRDEVNTPGVEWAARIHDFREFLMGLSSVKHGQQLITQDLAEAALQVWWKFSDACPEDLSVPDVGAGSRGDLLLIWKWDVHYLSVEMAPETQAELFYRNDQTGALWGLEFDPNADHVPTSIIEKLSFFFN